MEPGLAAAIGQLPAFIRSPLFLPTERVPLRDALAGLQRVQALYDSELDRIHRQRLRTLKADRTSRRCFIIGSGPSLARTDLSRLKAEATFATNDFFLRMPALDWSPTYYVVEDHVFGEDRAEELSALSGTTRLFPASLAYALRPDEHTIYFDHRPRKSAPDGFDFSFEADVNTWTGGAVSFTCMQLAAYLGYQEIYLVGIDDDDAVDMLDAYQEARRSTEARGVSIVNATVGGELDVFARIDYDSLFRPEPVERLLLIDHTLVGNATATGEVKSAILGNWPKHLLMQVHDTAKGRLRIADAPAESEPISSLAGPVEAFEPDVIFYRPVPRSDLLHEFAMELIDQTNLPLALWIVDDWPTAYALEEPARAAELDADFRWLLARADVRFSISPAMSAAFHERYGQPFVPIANGITPADWEPARLRQPGPVRVRYAGGLAENMTFGTIGAVARVVERLAETGLDISFEIRTHGHWRQPSVEWMLQLQHTSVTSSDLAMADYRRWLAGADILLIAYNFDARSRDYIRYSLANKLPECLASGAAVLAVGPSDVGTIAAMAALDVGERVTVADEELLSQTLRRLAESPERRFELAAHSQAVAFSLFNVSQVRQAFDAGVSRVASAHHAGEYPRDLHAHVDETAVVAGLLGERRGAGHVMVDVGAHGGSSAVHFARLGWTVHCFEPHPGVRAALAARFAKNKRLRVDPRAVGDAPATDVPLYESPESTGITSLRPFHPSHRATVKVEVTTIAEVARELDLSKVDFLKIDVEGLDLAVLRGVPWGDLLPDVIECEFEDAKTLAQGHAWRDIGVFLRDQGYAVYVSEWHPVIRYGTRHDWRRVAPFGEDLDVHPAGWGNFVAFRRDPGWPAVRRAFDRNVVRGAVPAPARPRRARPAAQAAARVDSTPAATLPGSRGPSAAALGPDRRIVTAAAATAPIAAASTGRAVPARPGRAATSAPPAPKTAAAAARPRPSGSEPHRGLRRRAPTVRRMYRLTRRVVRYLLRRPVWTAVAFTLLAAWTLLGFTPALAPVSWLIWGSVAFSTVAFAGLYVAARAQRSIREMSRDISRLRRGRATQRKRFANAKKRMRRLERALAKTALMNADLSRDLRRLAATIERGQAAAMDRQADDLQRHDRKVTGRIDANGESADEDAPVRFIG